MASGNLSILVVEDDIALQTFTCRVIRHLHRYAEIDWAVTADDAIRRLAERPNGYNLILADVFTPGSLNGLDVWRYAREYCPRTAVIIMSGMPPETFMPEAERISRAIPPFLPKPFYVDEFKKVLETLDDPLMPVA